MRPNKIKKLMLDGKPVVNGWLQIPSSFSAEVMANQGWDSLTIDMQHGVIDYQKILSENKYDETSVPIEIFETNEPNGTEIIILTTDEILDYFYEKYDSKKITDNLLFDMAFTYNPKILNGKHIYLEFYKERKYKFFYISW